MTKLIREEGRGEQGVPILRIPGDCMKIPSGFPEFVKSALL